MENLLSGLIGAFLATFLAIFYQFIFERKKIRSEILLDVVEYLDEIYTNLQSVHVEKDARYKNREGQLSTDEYNRKNVMLRDLINTHRIAVRLEISYGQGTIVQKFNRLKAFLIEAAMSLWEGRESDWIEKSRYIHKLFSEKIDPARKDFESLLLTKTRAVEIFKDLCLPKKLFQGTVKSPRCP